METPPQWRSILIPILLKYIMKAFFQNSTFTKIIFIKFVNKCSPFQVCDGYWKMQISHEQGIEVTVKWVWSKRLHPRAGFGASCLVWRLLYWMLHAVQRRVDEFNTESKGTTSLFQSNRMNFPNGGWPTALFWKLSGVFLGSKSY